MNVVPNKSADESVAAIATLDLDPLKIKLMDAEEGPGWSRLKADQMAVEYRRFLILLARYPEQTIAPSKEVDKFWHAHILDTLKYAQDCETVFGYFLHHFPYFGMRGAEDAANLAEAALATARLYEQEFGATATVTQDAAGTGYCGATSVSSAEAAYCGATQASSYCGATSTASNSASRQTAYCGKADTPAYCGKASAYCGKASAYCGKASAYCGKASAYCGKASAYCGKASAYCGKASGDTLTNPSGQTDKMRSDIRPTLPF